MDIVIVGGTSAIAQACARILVERGSVSLALWGRDEARLSRVAADLRVRSPASTIALRTLSFLDPGAIRAAVDSTCEARVPDVILIAHGSLPDQLDCENSIEQASEALMVNGCSPALFAEAFAHHLERAQKGTLVLIGSVAGDRGRKKNYVYGAAKGLLDRYAEGLQHRFAQTPVRVVLVKPGPTATPMTAHLSGDFATVESVAERIVRAADAGWSVVYAPAKWRLIMLIIRHLPRVVFHRLSI